MANKEYATIGGEVIRINYNSGSGECEWEGCEGIARAHGLCNQHYTRARYSKELEHLIPDYARASRCSHEGCDNPAYCHKYCRNHYARLKRNGNLDPYSTYINPLRFRVAMWMRDMRFEDVAARVGVSRQMIHVNVSSARCVYKRAQELADALHVSLDWLSDPRPPEIEGLDPLVDGSSDPLDLSSFGTDPSKSLRLQQIEREHLQYSEVKRGVEHAINQMAILPRSLSDSLDNLNTYMEDTLENLEKELAREGKG